MQSLLVNSLLRGTHNLFEEFIVFRQLQSLLTAQNYMLQVYECKVEPTITACQHFCEFQRQFGRSPLLREFIQYVYRPCQMECEYQTPIGNAIEIMEYLLIEYGMVSQCRLVYLCYCYQQFEHRYPTKEEIMAEMAEYMVSSENDSLMTQLMNQDTEEYWSKKTSGIDLSKLSTQTVTEPDSDMVCCICQEPIQAGQTIVILPCKHSFHYIGDVEHVEEDRCQGVKPWLEKVNACPLCKQSVETQEQL